MPVLINRLQQTCTTERRGDFSSSKTLRTKERYICFGSLSHIPEDQNAALSFKRQKQIMTSIRKYFSERYTKRLVNSTRATESNQLSNNNFIISKTQRKDYETTDKEKDEDLLLSWAELDEISQ